MTVFLFCDAYKVWISLLFLEFANSNPVEGFNDGTLQMTFTELRQVGILDVWGGVVVFIVCYVSQLVDFLMTVVWCVVWCGMVWYSLCAAFLSW